MNEAALSVEPEVKTHFATVDDAAFERPKKKIHSHLIIMYNCMA
jgi:hypothetical protein